MPACPMTVPSSMAVRGENVAAAAAAVVAEGGGRTMTKADSPFVGE